MFSNEGVIHYVTVIRLQDFLKLCDVIVLVGTVIKQQQKNQKLSWFTSAQQPAFKVNEDI